MFGTSGKNLLFGTFSKRSNESDCVLNGLRDFLYRLESFFYRFFLFFLLVIIIVIFKVYVGVVGIVIVPSDPANKPISLKI